MNQPKEANWESIFAQPKAKIEMHFAKKCTCGSSSCKRAVHIRCSCGCGGINHSIENRKGMSALDEALGLDKTDAETLPSQPEILRLDPLVSRELIYIG